MADVIVTGLSLGSCSLTAGRQLVVLTVETQEPVRDP